MTALLHLKEGLQMTGWQQIHPPACLCMAKEDFYTFLNSWGKKKTKERYFLTCEIQMLMSLIKFDWDTATFILSLRPLLLHKGRVE